MDLKDYFQEKKQILEFLQMHDLFPNVINDARIGIISTKVVNERTKYRSILFRNQKWTSIDTDKGATLNSVKGSRKRNGISKDTDKLLKADNCFSKTKRVSNDTDEGSSLNIVYDKGKTRYNPISNYKNNKQH